MLPATSPRHAKYADLLAIKGCSKCLKSFSTEHFGEKADFSGFDRENWELRNANSHRRFAEKHVAAKTQAAQTVIEHGCRYSCLLELPLLFGSCCCVSLTQCITFFWVLLSTWYKHMVRIWKEREEKQNQFEEIQSLVDSFVVPNDVGRTPSKISSGYSGFTAEQWRNWTVLFSSHCLKDLHDFNCWQLFTKACSLLCRRLQQLQEADELLINLFEQLYGKEYCNINLHLHAHMKTCSTDQFILFD